MTFDADSVRAASSAYVKPVDFHPSYGTAGFRANADLLASTVFRCGLLAAARALLLGAHTGIMITASHNPVEDNGVKMVDPDGNMMPQSFEPVAAELANCQDDEAVVAVLRDRVFGQANLSAQQHLTVLIGYDTRPSAPHLLAAATAGVLALKLHAVSCGCITTPQLHFLVHNANHGSSSSSDSDGSTAPSLPSAPASPQLQTYFDTILGAFVQLAGTTASASSPTSSSAPTSGAAAAGGAAATRLFVDCANGVGAGQLQRLVPALQAVGIELQLRNSGEAAGGGQLNHKCGADFVQKERLPPAGFEDVPAGAQCCSIDGDADRLVYFSPQPASGAPAAAAATTTEGVGASSSSCGAGIMLLDGDKIALLAAVFIRDLMAQLPQQLLEGVKVCCVQTAYANGASTAFLREVLQLPAVCTPTGVKYLHEAAHEADLGVYFESNGHGTVLFSQQLRRRLEAAAELPAARELLALSRLINQTVGDAISGLLLVELILRRKGWTLADWQALYTDLPSRQLKLKVADRSSITTADAERVCVTPAGLQQAIDRAVSGFPKGRAFARPSGTEDAVRVYAEAATQQQADELARAVAQEVYDRAGGVGPRP